MLYFVLFRSREFKRGYGLVRITFKNIIALLSCTYKLILNTIKHIYVPVRHV